MANEKRPEAPEGPTTLVLYPEGAVSVGSEPKQTLVVGKDVAAIERRWGGFFVTALDKKQLTMRAKSIYVPDSAVKCACWGQT